MDGGDPRPRRNARLAEAEHDLVAAASAVGPDADHVGLVVRQGAVRFNRWVDAWHVGECLVVARTQPSASFDDLVETPHLGNADRSLEVGHAVVESELSKVLGLWACRVVPMYINDGFAVRSEAP